MCTGIFVHEYKSNKLKHFLFLGYFEGSYLKIGPICKILNLKVFDNGKESITRNGREREREKIKENFWKWVKFIIQARRAIHNTELLFIEPKNTYKTKSSRSSILTVL